MPRLKNEKDSIEGDNRNVVFFFARGALCRVLEMTADDPNPLLFWIDGERERERPEKTAMMKWNKSIWQMAISSCMWTLLTTLSGGVEQWNTHLLSSMYKVISVKEEFCQLGTRQV